MSFTPELEFAHEAVPLIYQDDDGTGLWKWTPIYQHGCEFAPAHFDAAVSNLVANPDITSTWLFRADVLSESHGDQVPQPSSQPPPQAWVDIPVFAGFRRTRAVVRRLVPRDTQRDRPLEQTCVFYASPDRDSRDRDSLVVYLPHMAAEADIPFYHPRARGVAYLHKWQESRGCGTISIHYALFSSEVSTRLRRTALGLLSVLYKHGEGTRTGYVKRVQHDTLVPRAALQDRYQTLKSKYAKSLIAGWLERTDPQKHVFEDLWIAAFLMQLWDDMYESTAFPKFVDIGCGNGLLVHILNNEGYAGWGFDARARKSWAQYNATMMSNGDTAVADGSANMVPSSARNTLQQLVLVPSALADVPGVAPTSPTLSPETDPPSSEAQGISLGVHPGIFPPGTFIISNHADELTPWTPILAAASNCPFIAIPCCSHQLGGAKFRAPPPPKDRPGAAPSTYGSLVEWVADIAADCGWDVERETLRIPSTRNRALIGRRRRTDASDEPVDIQAVIAKYGGAAGYVERAMKPVATGPREH